MLKIQTIQKLSMKENLYECHGHLLMDGTEYSAARARHENGPVRAILESELADLQKAGVTYFRDGGDPLGVSLLGRDLAPEFGIEYVSPAFAIHKKGRYGSIVGRAFADMDDYRQRLREVGECRGNFVKFMASGIITFRKYGELSCPPLEAEEIRQIITLAHEAGYSVMVHINGADTIRAAAEAGVDSVEHGYFADDAALEAMAANNVLWVPTLAAVAAFIDRPGIDHNGTAAETVRRQMRQLKRASEMGIYVASGSDSGAVGVPHGPGTIREYELLAEAGISRDWIEESNHQLSSRFSPKKR